MRKTDYILILVVVFMGVTTAYLLAEDGVEQMSTAQEAADSWKDITDCKLMQGKLISLDSESDFVGKDIIQSAINQRMEEVC